MAEVTVTGGKVGVDVIQRRADVDTLYRLWIDKGRGKYKAIDIEREDVEHVLKMIQSTLGGARSNRNAARTLRRRYARQTE